MEETDAGWEEGTLGDYADNVRDNVKTENLLNFENYVGLEHIQKKNIVLYESGNTEQVYSNKSQFKKFDILFGKLRSYFHKVVFAPYTGVCSTDILVIRPKKEAYFSFCLMYFFSDEVVQHSDLGAEGTRMPRTNWEILSKYEITKPSEKLISDFDGEVRPMIELMLKNVQQIQTLTKLRDTLLPKLMSGEVRISHE